MKRNRWILFSLLLPAFVMLAATVIPHHHHDNGILCMHLPEEETLPDNDGHHTVPCLDDCVAKLHQAENTPEYILSQFHFLLLLSLTGQPGEPIVVPSRMETSGLSGIRGYRERLHGILFPSSSGLRAPPALIG